MALGDKRVTLHYGGEAFKLLPEHADVLDDYNGEPGVIKLSLEGGKWLTIAVGPGIPVLIEESVSKGPARAVSFP